MAQEGQRSADKSEIDFKNLLFANNPDMYLALYEREPEIDDEQVEWFVPHSEADLKKILKEMEAFGGIPLE